MDYNGVQQPGLAPCAVIVEQPARNEYRFRYKTECQARGGSAGSIPGEHNTPQNKTYPTLKVCGLPKGTPIVVVASCLTTDYRAHPNELVGRNCSHGIYVNHLTVGQEDPVIVFDNVGVQCTTLREAPDALALREQKNVDPFYLGFDHKDRKNAKKEIIMGAVRLGFQVFTRNPDTWEVSGALPSVATDVIVDTNKLSKQLVIVQISCTKGPASGGTSIFILCKKLTGTVEVVLYEARGDMVVWESPAHISLVHEGAAIVCTTPPYSDAHTAAPVTVSLQMRRQEDNKRSAPVDFEYIPNHHNMPGLLQSRLNYYPGVEPINQQLVDVRQVEPQPGPSHRDVPSTSAQVDNYDYLVRDVRSSLMDLADVEIDKLLAHSREELDLNLSDFAFST